MHVFADEGRASFCTSSTDVIETINYSKQSKFRRELFFFKKSTKDHKALHTYRLYLYKDGKRNLEIDIATAQRLCTLLLRFLLYKYIIKTEYLSKKN